MEGSGLGVAGHHALLLPLDLELDEPGVGVGDRHAEVQRLAVVDGSRALAVSFADGRVALYAAAGAVSGGDRNAVDAPRLQRSWRLPSDSGIPSALASIESKGTDLLLVGTKSGAIFILGPGEGTLPAGSRHAPAAVTVLLVGPVTDGPGGRRAVFSADSEGRIVRSWLPDISPDAEQAACLPSTATELAPTEVFADLKSPVLSLEICDRSGRLLASTAERIAILQSVLEPGSAGSMRFVGSKPHKGQYTATFSRTFGPEGLISARPGGRLWVAESATGTVQSTLKFQGAGGDDKAALSRLLALSEDRVLSWTREEDCPKSEATVADSSASLVLLDLEAIAVSQKWSKIAPVVDAVRWAGGVLLAHKGSVSLLLMGGSLALLRALMSRSRLQCDPSFLATCLQHVLELKENLGNEASSAPGSVLATLRPLTEAVPEACIPAPAGSPNGAQPELPGLVELKRWVSQLEDMEIEADLAAAGPSTIRVSLRSAGPLANFPVADWVASPARATPSACPPPVAALQAAGAAQGLGCQRRLTPQLLQHGRHLHAALSNLTSKAAATTGIPATAAMELGPPATAVTQPQPSGVVLRALASPSVPFVLCPEVVEYSSQLLSWLAEHLDILAPQGLAAPAASAFELLCLFVSAREAPAPAASDSGRGSPGTGWPVLGFLPELGAPELDQVTAASVEPMAREHLAAQLLAVAAAVRAEEATDSASVAWPPEAALGFCQACLASIASQAALERCLFRANGLAATRRGPNSHWNRRGWWQVVGWLRDQLVTTNVHVLKGDWGAAIAHADSFAQSAEPSRGVAEVHSILAAALGPSGAPSVMRQAFEAALSLFPKVLPWNLREWTQLSEQKVSAGGVLQREYLRVDKLSHYMLQYLLRLLTRCESCPDFESLLEMTLAVSLHPSARAASSQCQVLHAGRSAVTDTLLRRYGKRLHADLLCKLRYPLGALQLSLLLEGRPGSQTTTTTTTATTTAADAPATPNLPCHFKGSVAAAVRALVPEPMPSPQLPARALDRIRLECPVCAPLGRACPPGVIEVARGCAVSGAEGLAGRGLGQMRELAEELHRLCWFNRAPEQEEADKLEVSREQALCRWRHVLNEVACVAAESTAAKQLLAALASVGPGLEAAAVCARAASTWGTQESAAELALSAAASALWAAALGPPGSEVGQAGLAVKAGSALTASWLELPASSRQPPERPQPPWQRRQRAAANSLGAAGNDDPGSALPDGGIQKPSGLRQVGTGEQLWVSDDGLMARHSDDTGEEMCGVLAGWEPLVLGRAGAYFEVVLDELRPGECFDGLTVGVTATDPASLADEDPPGTAEHIPETWAVGYDGQMWDASTGTLCQVGWDPRSLEEGDVIGVLVTAAQGELLVFRNGVACCAGPRAIPVASRAIYPVVDLLGAARAVRWVSGAEPPTGESQPRAPPVRSASAV
ncbi:unnamed protein product [Polarella glacialis]|uniref:B30.2/SPRY domain-containing protein n=1 Tax=Polarella glacialis TaxID=89957 RepID=A0A813DFM9_POLGL|nr:unnamed protein product [Polarella glacialis]CAE8676640.1 unnamed protein product [Polarella glacialis]